MLGQLENYFIEAYSRTCHSASVETPIAAMIKREVEGRAGFICSGSAKERRTHTSGTKETFPTDESSVGSNKKSCPRHKITYGLRPMRVYWPAVDCLNLSKAGLELGCSSKIDSIGRVLFTAEAYCSDGRRFIIPSDEKLSAFLET